MNKYIKKLIVFAITIISIGVCRSLWPVSWSMAGRSKTAADNRLSNFYQASTKISNVNVHAAPLSLSSVNFIIKQAFMPILVEYCKNSWCKIKTFERRGDVYVAYEGFVQQNSTSRLKTLLAKTSSYIFDKPDDQSLKLGFIYKNVIVIENAKYQDWIKIKHQLPNKELITGWMQADSLQSFIYS